MLKIHFITSCLLAAGHLYANTEIKGTPDELRSYLAGIPKTVVISGEAEVRLPADKAIVSLKVTTESKALHDTLRSNQELRSRLAASLQKQGISAERIRASRFSSTPKFGMFGEKAKSYRVDNVIRVTVQDERELQIAASAVDGWSEVQFLGTEFEHVEKDALKAKAVAEACENAETRRKVFEQKLGFKLKPSKFTGGAVAQQMPAMGHQAYERKTLAYPSSATAAKGATFGDTTALQEDVSSFGELVYNAQVNIEYEVQEK
jgi:uncharacterized protein